MTRATRTKRLPDRRSKTSRRNLGESIPEALSPEGTTSIGVRLPKSLLARVDAAAEAAGMTRAAWLREAVEALLEAQEEG